MKKVLIFIVLNLCLLANVETFAETFAETFKGKQFVTYGELLKSIEAVAKTLENSPVMKQEFKVLQNTHGVDDRMYKDYVRVRLAFEATRDSGLWQIRWAVTDQEPNSDNIWKQWNNDSTLHYQSEQSAQATATAECDELSALFAIIARGLGVREVGLFWPASNHTVAVWKAKGNGKDVRIIIPTSQIFLDNQAGLGTKAFDPNTQKTIYNYSRKDIKVTDKIPGKVAEMMVSQLKKYGGKPAVWLQKRRNTLSKKFGGS